MKTLAASLIGICLPICAFAQIPFDEMSKGVELTYKVEQTTVWADDGGKIVTDEYVEVLSILGSEFVAVRRAANEPSGEVNRAFVGTKNDVLFNYDPLSWTKLGRAIRFELTNRPVQPEIFSTSYYLDQFNILELIRKHPPKESVSSFSENGDQFRLEIDPAKNKVRFASIALATGATYKSTVLSFENLDDHFVPSLIESHIDYKPNTVTKKVRLVSLRRIKKLNKPFSREKLPVGSHVSDKIGYTQFEVNNDGIWIKIGELKRPDYAQLGSPDTARRAALFVVSTSVALAMVATSLYRRGK